MVAEVSGRVGAVLGVGVAVRAGPGEGRLRGAPRRGPGRRRVLRRRHRRVLLRRVPRQVHLPHRGRPHEDRHEVTD